MCGSCQIRPPAQSQPKIPFVILIAFERRIEPSDPVQRLTPPAAQINGIDRPFILRIVRFRPARAEPRLKGRRNRTLQVPAAPCRHGPPTLSRAGLFQRLDTLRDVIIGILGMRHPYESQSHRPHSSQNSRAPHSGPPPHCAPDCQQCGCVHRGRSIPAPDPACHPCSSRRQSTPPKPACRCSGPASLQGKIIDMRSFVAARDNHGNGCDSRCIEVPQAMGRPCAISLRIQQVQRSLRRKRPHPPPIV